jgi:uncharacterized membrane protein YccC
VSLSVWLLWAVTAVACAAGTLAVVRPSWPWVFGLTTASVVWAAMGLGGPVLVSRGSHGVHVADLPIAVAIAAAVVVAFRLWRRRSHPGGANTK